MKDVATPELAEGIDLLRKGDWEGAERLFRQVLERDPASLQALRHLADLHYCRSRLRGALREYLRTLRRHPLDGETYRNLAILAATILRKFLRNRGRKGNGGGWLRKTSLAVGLGAAGWAESAALLFRSRRIREILPENSEGLRFSFRSVFDILSRCDEDLITSGLHYPRTIEVPLALNSLQAVVGDRVLDVGCGGAVTPAALARRGVRVVGVDMDRGALLRQREVFRRAFPEAWRLGNLCFLLSDGRRLPFPDEAFQKVLAVSALEHIPGSGDSETMAEIGRVLAPGGRAFVSVEHGDAFREEWFSTSIGVEYEGGEDRQARWLVRYYDPESLAKRIIEPSGLEVLDRGFFGETSRWGAHGLVRSPAWDPLPPSACNPLLGVLFGRRLSDEELDKAAWKVPFVVLGKPLKRVLAV